MEFRTFETGDFKCVCPGEGALGFTALADYILPAILTLPDVHRRPLGESPLPGLRRSHPRCTSPCGRINPASGQRPAGQTSFQKASIRGTDHIFGLTPNPAAPVTPSLRANTRGLVCVLCKIMNVADKPQAISELASSAWLGISSHCFPAALVRATSTSAIACASSLDTRSTMAVKSSRTACSASPLFTRFQGMPCFMSSSRMRW